MSDQDSPSEEHASASSLIQRIRAGAIDPAILNKEQRQACVEVLFFESTPTSAMADFLRVTDRTIRRDLEDIRTRNALNPDPDLARQIIGEHVMWTRAHRSNLMKLARKSDASVGERAQAEYYAHMVDSDFIAKLQSLGYLPKSADALVLMQKEGEVPDNKIDSILADLDAMAAVENPEAAAQLLAVKEKLASEKIDESK